MSRLYQLLTGAVLAAAGGGTALIDLMPIPTAYKIPYVFIALIAPAVGVLAGALLLKRLSPERASLVTLVIAGLATLAVFRYIDRITDLASVANTIPFLVATGWYILLFVAYAAAITMALHLAAYYVRDQADL